LSKADHRNHDIALTRKQKLTASLPSLKWKKNAAHSFGFMGEEISRLLALAS